MNLQKTTQYALKVLCHMALNPENPYTADRINEETGIPKRYLRRLMTELAKAGFIRSSRGRTGGYVFARPPVDISLYSIVECFEKDSLKDKCILGFTFCVRDEPCVMHNEWADANELIFKVLRETNLEKLKNKPIQETLLIKKV